ncbi:MAG: dTDP-4-dehydrorhamnose reductase [Bacteroidota bacterium]
MEKKRILVTGANGQLGKELRDLAPQYKDADFLFVSREDLPIHHFDLVRNVFDSFKPHFCINAAAYTAVDKAETEQELAHLINAEAVGVLAAVSAAHDCRFVHVSTDYVYDGSQIGAHKESDATAPVSVYGKTKLEGEQLAMQLDPQSIVIRTSWVYSRYGNNFVKTMMRLMQTRDQLSVVDDQWGSPTYAADLASCILDIMHHPQWQPGIYNFSNDGRINWYQFALEIKTQIGSACKINPIPSADYPTPAKRPANSWMDKQKIVGAFGIQLIDWKLSLSKCIKAIEVP